MLTRVALVRFAVSRALVRGAVQVTSQRDKEILLPKLVKLDESIRHAWRAIEHGTLVRQQPKLADLIDQDVEALRQQRLVVEHGCAVSATRAEEESLEAAVEGSDIPTLEDAIRVAETAGVATSTMAVARTRLEQLSQEEEARLQLRKQAAISSITRINSESARRSVVRVDDVRAFEEAVEKAEAEGCAVESARTRLEEIRQKCREDAAAALQRADIDEEALREAEAAGVSKWKLGQARTRMARTAEQRRAGLTEELAVATTGVDIARLERAIRHAEPLKIDCGAARDRLFKLREERRVAKTALDAAVEGSDIPMLEDAISAAAACSVEVGKARERLVALRTMRMRAAAAALAAAVHGTDVRALEDALEQAEAANALASEIAAAKEKLAVLIDGWIDTAASALAKACEGDRIAPLEITIEEVDLEVRHLRPRHPAHLDSLGRLSGEELVAARERLGQLLERRTAAANRLTTLLENSSPDIEALKEAFTEAKEAEVDDVKMASCRAKLAVLQDTLKRQASDSLAAAIIDGDCGESFNQAMKKARATHGTVEGVFGSLPKRLLGLVRNASSTTQSADRPAAAAR